jgi:Na+/serine symporter
MARLIPLACSLFGIYNNVVMQGGQVTLSSVSCKTQQRLLNSSTDIDFTAWRSPGEPDA